MGLFILTSHSLDLVFLPEMSCSYLALPLTSSVHSEPSCNLPGLLQPEAFTDHPTHMPLQPLHAPGRILPDRILNSL